MEVDVVVVDDGSCDGTAELVSATSQAILKDLNRLVLVQLATSCGKDPAILAGLSHGYRDSDVVIVMDGDGQHPTSVLDELFVPHEAFPFALIVAVPDHDWGHWSRRIGRRAFGLLLSRSTVQSDFALVPNMFIAHVRSMMSHGDTYKDAMTWLNTKVLEVSFSVPERSDGQDSRFTLARLIALAARRSLSHGREALVASTLIQLVVVALALAGLVINWAIQGEVASATFLVAIMALLVVSIPVNVYSLFVALSSYARQSHRPQFQVSRIAEVRGSR